MKDSNQVNTIVDAIIEYLELRKALDLLPEISQKLTEKSWVKVDPDLAIVSAPIKLNSSQLKAIQKSLAKIFGRPIKVKSQIDQSIIGGFKINVAGKIIDATINHRLESLKEKIIYD